MTTTYGFVYLWRDRKHNRYYVGCHWGAEDDGYVCSSSWMKQAFKRRPKDFKRRILTSFISTRSKTFAVEQQWLALIKDEELRYRYYNLCKSSKNLWHQDDYRRLTIGQKISAKKIGSKLGPRPQHVKDKISSSKRGKKPSKEHRQKVSDALKGSKKTAEHRAAIGKGLKKAYAEGRRS